MRVNLTVSRGRWQYRCHVSLLVAADVSPLKLLLRHYFTLRMSRLTSAATKANCHECVRVHHANLREFLASLELAGNDLAVDGELCVLASLAVACRPKLQRRLEDWRPVLE